MAEELTDGGAERRESSDKPGVGGIWQVVWGLRLSLVMVAVLVWTGATGASSLSSSAEGHSNATTGPPAATAPASPPSPQTAPAATVNPGPPTAALPQQSLEIIYDYGPGPQPVPGPAPSP